MQELAEFFNPADIGADNALNNLQTTLRGIEPGAPTALGAGTLFERDNRVTRAVVSIVYPLQFGRQTFEKYMLSAGYYAELPKGVLSDEISRAIDEAGVETDHERDQFKFSSDPMVRVLRGSCSIGDVELCRELGKCRIPGGFFVSVKPSESPGERIYTLAFPNYAGGKLYFEYAGDDGPIVLPGKARLRDVANHLIEVFSTLKVNEISVEKGTHSADLDW